MTSHQTRLEAVAKAEDTQDLLGHIAWTDVVRPRFQREIEMASKLLVNEALGAPLPGGLTREQVAGRAYGLNWTMTLLEQILKDGKRALDQLNLEGITINT